jgi:hypothetical protein
MKAVEFESTLGKDSNLKVPEDIASCLPQDETVRVIVLIPDAGNVSDWRQLTRDQFLAGYSDGDNIYDAV